MSAGESRLRGLYAITSQAVVTEPGRLLGAVAAALRGGVRLLQYRDKWNPAAVRERHVRRLLPLCRAHGVPLIVNDDAELARATGADGVHLGAADAALDEARRLLGRRALIGATCGNSLQRARAAVAAGADYVAFGRFFPSTTKPDAPPAELATLRAARAELDVPLCAIGGVSPDHVPLLIEAGADLVAAIAGVFDAADVETAARAYAKCFT
ncbi:thiamine phosphate synthase [Fontimonas sp. SYSU GA230001]|uniref:thiamine phosphate synthase n=1 Tax=Fontimonas sp. SYSU GA230001 TaxID=3142450 RepID=UPI0032B4F55C